MEVTGVLWCGDEAVWVYILNELVSETDSETELLSGLTKEKVKKIVGDFREIYQVLFTYKCIESIIFENKEYFREEERKVEL